MDNNCEVARAVKSIVKNENLDWNKVNSDEFNRLSSRENIQPLLYYLLHEQEAWQEVPLKVKEALSKSAKAEFLVEERRHSELKSIFSQFHKRNLSILVFKGSALSPLLYPKSGLRPRCDTDLLVKKEDLGVIEEVLNSKGYHRTNKNSGSLISYQIEFSKTDKLGFRTTLDVHWKLSNPQIFSSVFSLEELLSESVTIEDLQAKAPCLTHSLIIACIHRVAHHFDEEEVLWLYDIHLILKKMTAADFEKLEKIARQKHIGQICRRGISLCQEWFGTPIPEGLLSQLDVVDEITSKYLNPRRKWLHDIIWDFQNLEGVRSKISYLIQHAVPSQDYMLKKYPGIPRSLLGLTYVFRFLSGIRKIPSRLKP